MPCLVSESLFERLVSESLFVICIVQDIITKSLVSESLFERIVSESIYLHVYI